MDSIRIYEYNISAATALLEADGWTLNRDGRAYDRAKDVERLPAADRPSAV